VDAEVLAKDAELAQLLGVRRPTRLRCAFDQRVVTADAGLTNYGGLLEYLGDRHLLVLLSLGCRLDEPLDLRPHADRAMLREAAEALDAAQWMCREWREHEETRLRINDLVGRLEALAGSPD
jgi:hypothetical protein